MSRQRQMHLPDRRSAWERWSDRLSRIGKLASGLMALGALAGAFGAAVFLLVQIWFVPQTQARGTHEAMRDEYSEALERTVKRVESTEGAVVVVRDNSKEIEQLRGGVGRLERSVDELRKDQQQIYRLLVELKD